MEEKQKPRDQLIVDEVEQAFDWLEASVPIADLSLPVDERKTYTVDELIEDSDLDIYEVHVILHMCNGETLHARNYCAEHLGQFLYNGDHCEYYEGILHIDIQDERGFLRQHSIPPSSIAWVEVYSEDVDWKLVKQQQEKQ